MTKHYIFTILAALYFTHAGTAQSTGTLTDLRDGQTYKTISFKNVQTGTTVTTIDQVFGVFTNVLHIVYRLFTTKKL